MHVYCQCLFDILCLECQVVNKCEIDALLCYCVFRNKGQEHVRSHTTDPLLHSETPQESEDTGAGSWYSTRTGVTLASKDVLCPHGLATLARHQPIHTHIIHRSHGHYADSTELQRTMPVGESAAGVPLPPPPPSCYDSERGSLHGDLVHYPSPEPPRICRPNSPGRDLDPPAEMQTSFITFKPGSPRKCRTLDRGASLDLIKDSQPYRTLNPETLVVECTCTLRQGQHNPLLGPRDTEPEGKESANKSV